MKKTIIFSAIALCASLGTIHAKTARFNVENSNVVKVFKVNSFCVSIAKGDIETVKKLLSLGEDVNQRSNGMTPVMYAAKYNRTEILELLIAKGANLKTKSDKKMTAADYAKLHGAIDAHAIIEQALSKK
ncbi:ankyrin repeat domain-containing protein [Mariniflexile sp. AS56]|uniref:ankyrin repeat domain-containing protein n=1 Tax=Mariniflexile sp. AS56 TaxID=3063957 RepID=UPI0026E9E3AD|nr:ankyrin repeat domain-containing protein [Mariniflexile sp. AS56]MDO7171887.1 ankyrin repeat domain-containing protein [Mariniflexile sp. AS56]